MAAPAISASVPAQAVEYFEVLNEVGAKTGLVKQRNQVHRDGDWHRAVHVWIYSLSTNELLLQQRAACKESWANLFDCSTAGHLSAGDDSLPTAQREVEEELGLQLPQEGDEQ